MLNPVDLSHSKNYSFDRAYWTLDCWDLTMKHRVDLDKRTISWGYNRDAKKDTTKVIYIYIYYHINIYIYMFISYDIYDNIYIYIYDMI